MLKIVVANKNYSSWSLRAWLALAATGAAYDEEVIPLDQPDTRQQILRWSPSARLPVLIDGDLVVWDSLAICEHLAERFPAAGLWPAAPDARAGARSAVAEMHSGFTALRQQLPMNLRRPPAPLELTAEVLAEVARVEELWRSLRVCHAAGGDFLCGSMSLVDCFYAPVVSRFRTYGVPVDSASAAYMRTIEALPAYRTWAAAGRAEPWIIPRYDSV